MTATTDPVRALLCGVLMSLSPGAAAQDSPVSQAGLEDVAASALQANPDLAAMRSTEAGLRARIDGAGTWMDPMVGVEYSNVRIDSLALDAHAMSGVQLRVQQTLPTRGSLVLQEQAASLRADAAGHATAEAELQLRATIARTWWLLVRSRLLAAVTAEHLERVDELRSAVSARYEVGAVGQSAILRVEVLQARLADELSEFQRADAELTAALTRAVGGELPPLDVPASVSAVPPPEPGDWRALAAQHRPMVRQLQVEAEAAGTSAALAQVSARPAWSVWAGYRVRTVQTDMDDGTDLVSVGVGAPIPLGSRTRADADRAGWLESQQAAGHRVDAALDTVDAELRATLARWERAWTKAQTYTQVLIPRASATMETTRSDFAVDRAEFASLFEAEVALLDLQRTRIAAQVQTHLEAANAAAALGIDPPGVTP